MKQLKRKQPENYGKEYYECPYCGEKFRQKYNYNLHIKKCVKQNI